MSLERFDYILAIAEEHTLTKASQKVSISQPALTNYVNKLEDELGVKLFDRSVTPIKVTKAGSVYIEKMKKIQQETNALENQLRSMGQGQRVFAIGIGATRGNHWLPLILPEFVEKHPELKIELVEKGESYLEKGVLSGEIDVAFGVLNTNYPELEYEEIVEEHVLIAIPRSFKGVSAVKEGEGTIDHPYLISPSCLDGMPFLFPYPGGGFYRCATMMLAQFGITPKTNITYANMNTAYRLAGEGLGALFITPDLFDRKFPELAKSLVFATLTDPPYERTCVAGMRKENSDDKAIQELIGIMKCKIWKALDDESVRLI